MIKLPRKLQPIHTFEKNGIWYVVHLQVGEVLTIDSVTADILALCGTNNNAGILEKLGGRYSEGQVLESLKALSDIEDLLFEADSVPISPMPCKDRLRIFVPHYFMKYRAALSPTTNVGIYNLLVALAKEAEVFVEIDNDSGAIEHREQLMALGIQFISDLFQPTEGATYASNRFVVEECDGILALSPHPYEELNYHQYNTIPVVARIFSDRNWREAAINKVLCHDTFSRSFDSVCPDTPWIVDELNVIATSHLERVETIPNGVDTQVYSPQNCEKARKVVAEMLGEERILDSRLIGIINGFQPPNSVGMIAEMANLHKEVVFIVFDFILGQDHSQQQQHSNVFYINLQQPQDTIALPWLYNACEFIIFPAVMGTPFSMVIEAFACGVPALALTSTELPEELAGGLVSVPLSRDDTTGRFIIPTAAVSEQVDVLLGPSGMRETLSTKAKQIADNYSWDRIGQRFVALFAELNRKRHETPIPKYPNIAFTPYYDKGQNVVKTGAMQLSGFFKQRVEEGLAQTLLVDHTPEEVRTVLRYLLQDDNKVDRLLSTLTQ